MPERVLTAAAHELRDRIEEVPGVLEGAIQGSRDDLVEVDHRSDEAVLLRPAARPADPGHRRFQQPCRRRHIEGSEGKYAVKVPALIETPEDVANLPVVAGPNAVVRVQDIATVRSTFKDAETITRLDGKPAIAIEVKKRIGANVVETIEGARQVVRRASSRQHARGLKVTYTQDKSVFVNQLLSDLQNHVMIAVILVFIVILYALSGRASLLIGLAIPSSFLMGILLLAHDGLHDQHDRAVLADPGGRHAGRRRHHRHRIRRTAHVAKACRRQQAFELAAKRMAGPVIAATMTRIAAFSPLLFWPGIVGDFMKYLPITLIVTLAASMAYALIFAPTIGAIFGKAPLHHEDDNRDGFYMAVVKKAVHFPITALVLTVGCCSAAACTPIRNMATASSSSRMSSRTTACSMCMPAATSRSTRWMPPRKIAENRHARLAGHQIGLYPRRQDAGGGQDIPEDVVGVIHYEFIDWRERKSAHQILDDLRGAMAGIPGVDVEVRVPDAGPPTGKPIQVRLSAVDPERARRLGPSRLPRALPRCPASSTFPTACRRPASTGRSRSTAPRRRNTASARPRSARSCSW